MDCFSRYSKLRASSLLKKTTASPNAIPFFVPPNDNTSTPARRQSCRRYAQRSDRVGEPRAVHVQRQLKFPRYFAQRRHLARRIYSAELRRLSEADRPRPGGMDVGAPDSRFRHLGWRSSFPF